MIRHACYFFTFFVVMIVNNSVLAQDQQVAMVKQQVWTNLTKVPGTERDFESKVVLRIANGNLIDADCTLRFPASSWMLASILLNEYKDVLKNTDDKIFEVIYKLITDQRVLASDITFSGLWRPFGGSHVHPSGRGIDISQIRNVAGDGVIFSGNFASENNFGNRVRDCLTGNFPVVTQYLSPWFMCSPVSNCVKNNRQTNLEKIHLTHLHLTLRP